MGKCQAHVLFRFRDMEGVSKGHIDRVCIRLTNSKGKQNLLLHELHKLLEK